MGYPSTSRQVAYSLLLFALLLLAVPRAGHGDDVGFWVRWANYGFEHGLSNVYQVPDNTYNPLFHYVLWLFGWLAGSTDNISYYRHWIKAFVLVFDFAGAFWAASLVQERDRRFGLVLLLVLNLGYLYNTLIWEQVDAIYTFFAFGAVVLAARQQAVGSMMCYVLAIAAKTQAIIFLPPLILLWVPLWWHRPGRLLSAVGAGVLLATLLLAPFIWWSWENYLPRIIAFNLSVAEVFPKLSMSAFNLWYLLAPEPSPPTVSDALPFAGFTYHKWGLFLFIGSSAVALLPMLIAALAQLHQSRTKTTFVPCLAPTLLSCGLIPLLFAFFNTQMHERYWHAAMLFLAAYGFLRRDYLPYVLVSAAYFLNLEAALRFLQLRSYSGLLFKPQFVATLFAGAIVLGLIKLYTLTPWREQWNSVWHRQQPESLV